VLSEQSRPRLVETTAVSVIKQKIKENLSQDTRYQNVSQISTVLADLVRFEKGV
jgi:hypothetical protein